MADPKEIFTERDCTAAVCSYLDKENVKVLSYTIRPLSENVEGLGGQHFIIKVQYEAENAPGEVQLFMKMLNPACKITFQLGMSINAYQKEVCFYKNLVSNYKKYKIDLSFAPKSYFSKPYLIVLDDLSLQGFKIVPKRDMLDINHAKKALDCLAKFHASSLIYEEIITKQMDSKYRLSENYYEQFEEKLFAGGENSAAEWFRVSIQGILSVIDLIPENHVTKDQFKEKVQEVFDNLPQLVRPSRKYRNAVIHGDLWTNNFLFKHENGKVVDCALIDFQLLKYGPPAIDVVQMIVTDTRKALRDTHFDELLNFYYDQLKEFVSKHEFNLDKLIPKADFLEACEEYQVPVRLQALADRSMTFLPSETFLAASKDDESMRKFLYVDRSESILSSYKSNAEFKDIMKEDLLELRDHLFK